MIKRCTVSIILSALLGAVVFVGGAVAPATVPAPAAPLVEIVAPEPAQAHLYNNEAPATLGDVNYAIALVCGDLKGMCVYRKPASSVTIRACTEHSWCGQIDYPTPYSFGWTHEEQVPGLPGLKYRCDTAFKSYHGQLAGVDIGGSAPWSWCKFIA